FLPSRRRHTISKRDWSSDVCSSDLNRLPVSPDPFQIVEQPVVPGEYVNDHVAVIHQDPACILVPFCLSADISLFSQDLLHIVRHILHLAGVVSVRDDKVIISEEHTSEL